MCESVVPKGYTLCDYFSVLHSGPSLFDKLTYECWVLVESASGEKEAIVLVMPDPDDVESVREFIHSDKNRVPVYEAQLAPPEEENAHYYMRITGYDE